MVSVRNRATLPPPDAANLPALVGSESRFEAAAHDKVIGNINEMQPVRTNTKDS